MIDRRSFLIGLMFKHFPLLRVEQVMDYSVEQMETVLSEYGISISMESEK